VKSENRFRFVKKWIDLVKPRPKWSVIQADLLTYLLTYVQATRRRPWQQMLKIG